jgi:hypothetical protein
MFTGGVYEHNRLGVKIKKLLMAEPLDRIRLGIQGIRTQIAYIIKPKLAYLDTFYLALSQESPDVLQDVAKVAGCILD